VFINIFNQNFPLVNIHGVTVKLAATMSFSSSFPFFSCSLLLTHFVFLIFSFLLPLETQESKDVPQWRCQGRSVAAYQSLQFAISVLRMTRQFYFELYDAK
jgi:hypothetical protein